MFFVTAGNATKVLFHVTVMSLDTIGNPPPQPQDLQADFLLKYALSFSSCVTDKS